MMSELFDEEYQRAAYNRASQKDAIEKGKEEKCKELAEKMKAKGYSEQEIAELLS